VQAGEMPIEARAQGSFVGPIRTGFREDYEVPSRKVRLRAKSFARESLESVTVHGALGGSAGDGQPEARDRAAAGSAEHGEKPVGGSSGLGEHSAEFGRRTQTLLGCESFPARKQWRANPKLVRASGERDPWLDDSQGLCGRSPWPSARGSRACACDASCWAGKFFS
jgi:hypothetical protein